MTIPVHEILRTIQGEGNRTGLPCTIVRTAGCNLECSWCDTDQSGVEVRDMTLEAIVEEVRALGTGLVLVTGGEPLIHAETPELCSALLAAGLEVLVETNGSLDATCLPGGVIRILDLKPPSSGMQQATPTSLVPRLGPQDEVKIVVADEEDYRWARRRLEAELASFPGTVHLSPLTPGMDPGLLARWILRDGLEVRLNLQVHKTLFPGGEGGC